MFTSAVRSWTIWMSQRWPALVVAGSVRRRNGVPSPAVTSTDVPLPAPSRVDRGSIGQPIDVAHGARSI